jgi:hypothetical protein
VAGCAQYQNVLQQHFYGGGGSANQRHWRQNHLRSSPARLVRFSGGTRAAKSIASAERASTASRSAATCNGAPAAGCHCLMAARQLNGRLCTRPYCTITICLLPRTSLHKPTLRSLSAPETRRDGSQLGHPQEDRSPEMDRSPTPSLGGTASDWRCRYQCTMPKPATALTATTEAVSSCDRCAGGIPHCQSGAAMLHGCYRSSTLS